MITSGALNRFISHFLLAWRQLTSEKKRFLAALAGVTFGLMLMMFQLGLYEAVMNMVARPLLALKGDLAITSRNYDYFASNMAFSRRRLNQAEALPEVTEAYPLHSAFMRWRNPVDGQYKRIFVLGMDPLNSPFILKGVQENLRRLTSSRDILYDALSGSDYGPAGKIYTEKGDFDAEIEGKRVRVRGLFKMGRTLLSNGNAIVGQDTFFRLMPHRPASLVNIGVVSLQPGADPIAVKKQLSTLLEDDVQVVTMDELIKSEQAYWRGNTPVGFVVLTGVIVAMIVGGVVLYQILYTDINDHMHEYATLKAIGWKDRYFFRVILMQALILLGISFLPGNVIILGINHLARTMVGLPAHISFLNLGLVFLLSLVMCISASCLVIRRLRKADPADLF